MKYTSALMAAASGSLGGITASRNRGGQYLRRRALVSNPNTEAQGIARENLATAVSTWTNTLTATDRQAWATYAQDTPVVNKLGNQIILSGQQMFVRSATARLIAGLAIITAGPTASGLGLTPQWDSDPTLDDAGNLGYSVTVPTSGTAGDLSLYVSRPVTSSRTPAHETRRWGGIDLAPVASVFAGTAVVTAFAFSVGQIVRVTAVYLDDTGRVSAEAFRDIEVTAAP